MQIYSYQDTPFPYGMADMKRRLCYFKGLQAAGDRVNAVVCNRVFERGTDNGMPAKGMYGSTPYCYICGKYKHPRWNKLMRGLDWYVLDPIRTFIFSLRHLHKGDIAYVYLYPLFMQAMILLAAKMKGAKTIKETCEHPGALRSHKFSRLADWIEFHLLMPGYDAFIVISRSLELFVERYKRRDAQVICIPILVDPEPYDRDYSGMQSAIDVPYIIHTGTMHEQKDSISKILHAFQRLRQEQPQLPCKLVFTGAQSNPKRCKYNKLIEQLGLTDDVILMGYVSDDEILRLQHFAAFSIIYKSDNLQTRNCFPTKLGEMLISQVPVITTTVGEANHYLQSGVNAYLFDENDESRLVSHMSYILSHPQEAALVAQRGREVALNTFNPISQGKRLSEFIHNINSTTR